MKCPREVVRHRLLFRKKHYSVNNGQGCIENLSADMINRLSSQREEILTKLHQQHNEICNRLAIYDTYFDEIRDRLNRQDDRICELIDTCARSSRGMFENFAIIHDALREHLRERRLIVDLLGAIHHQLFCR